MSKQVIKVSSDRSSGSAPHQIVNYCLPIARSNSLSIFCLLSTSMALVISKNIVRERKPSPCHSSCSLKESGWGTFSKDCCMDVANSFVFSSRPSRSLHSNICRTLTRKALLETFSPKHSTYCSSPRHLALTHQPSLLRSEKFRGLVLRVWGFASNFGRVPKNTYTRACARHQHIHTSNFCFCKNK
jgi:hypothetical protein